MVTVLVVFASVYMLVMVVIDWPVLADELLEEPVALVLELDEAGLVAALVVVKV
ncbi:hypothetical protein BJ508DRAFT_414705, partial [Ascobolus immersus RN42]